MRRHLFAWLLALLPLVGWAAEDGGAALDAMTPDLHDKASLQRGMVLFIDECAGCHSLQYQRFSRAARDLGIPRDRLEKNLIFPESLDFNDPIRTGMAPDDGEAWFGVAPPDLTLEARLRGTDWIYTYLHSFYRDPERPWGVNNTVFPGVAMPNVLEPLQGVQEPVCEDAGRAGGGRDPGHHRPCRTLEIVTPGRLSSAAFDRAMWDLTNFLAYVGEPARLQAEAIAPRVLIFLAVFALIAYLLKREYWRDVH
ncbi:cytochrome c1 [Modicisalibacter coralii]|uniref:cytochrome c1 n=1 Tax=Modicisalibacter coralii TaxID=2304602 RepID=UPI00100B8C14|nr:cytochrome c1 [Halomonas coralii]